jgi:Zn finger protein HypA/HybF involved in hydrogenase expression
MSMMYCHSCDRYINARDVEPGGCETCWNQGRLWCWACNHGSEFADIRGPWCPKCGEDYYNEEEFLDFIEGYMDCWPKISKF